MTTPLEDRLRSALHAAPAVDAHPAPIAEITRRGRRRQGGIAAAAALAIAGLIIGGLVAIDAGSGRANRPATTPTPSPSPPARVVAGPWPVKHVAAVTTTVDGSVWTLQRFYTNPERWDVVQTDADGKVLRRVHVPGPARGIAAGAGNVWVYGGGDGAYPDGVLSEINARGEVSSIRFHNSGPYDIAFVDGTPFVTLAAANRVAAIGSGAGGRLVVQGSVRLPSQVTDIVATPTGEVWAREDLVHKVVQIGYAQDGIGVGQDFSWKWGLIAAADAGNIVWTSDSADRLIGLDPDLAAHGSFSLAEGYRIGTPGQPIDVVGNGFNGGYVATTRGIAYYADLQLAAREDPSSPTAFLQRRGIASMAAAPTGGIIAVTSGGHAFRWDPGAGSR